MTDLVAEREILLCVARRVMDDSVKARLRQLVQTQVNWESLFQDSFEHGLQPLLYYHLNAVCGDLVPERILAKLKQEFIANSQCNLYLMRELIRTLDLLRDNDIQALVFKGPVLGSLVYGDLALRQAGDLDVLIEKENFPIAKQLLESIGYVMEPQLNGSQQSSHLRFHCEIQFVHHEQVSVVDLHWGVAPRTFPFSLDTRELLERSMEVEFAGHRVRTFSWEDLLLYLCMNGAKDNWSDLESVALVAKVLRLRASSDANQKRSSDDLPASEAGACLNWAALLERAQEAGGRKMLSLGVLLARNMFGTEMPKGVMERMSDKLQFVATSIEQKLLRGVRKPPTNIETFRMNLQCMDRKSDAVRALLRSVLVPTISDWKTITLPDALYPLYYFLRPIRLLGKYSMSERFAGRRIEAFNTEPFAVANGSRHSSGRE